MDMTSINSNMLNSADEYGTIDNIQDKEDYLDYAYIDKDNQYKSEHKLSLWDYIKSYKSSCMIFMNKFSLNTKVIYVWLIVALIIAIYRFISYVKMKNLILDLSYDAEDELEQSQLYDNSYSELSYNRMISRIYDDLIEELDINQNIQLRVSEEISIPFGIGILNKYIIIPKCRFEADEIRWILKHELIHYKNRDLVYKFLVMAVSVIYWFNPLVYIMIREINNDCELSCDESVLKNHSLNERKDYALTLIKSLKNSKSEFLKINMSTGFGNKEVLKRRFDNMFNKKSRNGMLIAGISIIVCGVSFFTFSNRNIEGTSAHEENPSASEISYNSSSDIELYTLSTEKYTGYYMEVKDPKRIKVVCSSTNGKVSTVAEMAEENNAVAAINGGAYIVEPDTDVNNFVNVTDDDLESGKYSIYPSGLVISNGEVIHEADFDDEVFAMTEDGKLLTGKYSLEQLKELNVKEALSFGPALIINGKMREMNGDGGWGIAPRTAIGQKEDGTIILLVIDGRSAGSLGATLKETQEILYKLGAINAVNLDGGKSSTMYYDGETLNNTEGRKIPTAIVVK